MATPILIDCDPGHDDAVALMLAVASPEVELVGVTTVVGNQTVEKTTANALRVLELCGRSDVPVARGARTRSCASDGRGARPRRDRPRRPRSAAAVARAVAEHAVSFLARQIREHDGQADRHPVGPLTNIALLLALEPDARPERIVLMGGSVGEGNRTPAAEFNIWADPEAARRVFESGIDITMIGLDVTHQALVTDANAERMRTSESRQGRRRALRLLRPLAQGDLPRPGRLPTARPGRRRARHRPDPRGDEARVHRGRLRLGAGRGRTNVDWRGRHDTSPPNATVGLGIDNEAFVKLITQRLASLG